MGMILNYLAILSLLNGFIITTPTRASISDAPANKETIHPKSKLGFFNNFGFPFQQQQPPPWQDGGGGGGGGATTESLGSWEIHSENAGVSAMHIQLMPTNKAVWYDSTSNGISEIENRPRSCRPRVGGRETDPDPDCTAHAIEYDVDTAQIRTLQVCLLLGLFNYDQI